MFELSRVDCTHFRDVHMLCSSASGVFFCLKQLNCQRKRSGSAVFDMK